MTRGKEIFVSTDVEADGPIPGVFSMLSLGAVALGGEKQVVSTFEVNLDTLPGAGTDPRTMRWWKKFPEAWAHHRTDPRPPEAAMRDFHAWVKGLPGRPVLLVYPAWDYMWVHWYLVRFTGASPFGLGALDLKSYAAAALGRPFHDVRKSRMPQTWFDPGIGHTHKALDDAMEQGLLFCNARTERLAAIARERPKPR